MADQTPINHHDIDIGRPISSGVIVRIELDPTKQVGNADECDDCKDDGNDERKDNGSREGFSDAFFVFFAKEIGRQNTKSGSASEGEL